MGGNAGTDCEGRVGVPQPVDPDSRAYVSPIAPSTGRATAVVTGYGAVVGWLYGLPVVLSGSDE